MPTLSSIAAICLTASSKPSWPNCWCSICSNSSPISSSWRGASVAFQAAVTVRDQYRPGNQWTVTGGYRHPVTPHLAAALQLNATARQRDTGVQAESDVTGGSFVFVSPGLSWGVSPVTELYAFVQAPVYRNVRGAQLTFDWAAVAGVSHRF